MPVDPDELWEALYPRAEYDERGFPGRPHWGEFRVAQHESADASRSTDVRLDELDKILAEFAR